MHDVFVVTSENWDGGRITRVIHAADQDDARQTHRDNYPDESIVAVATRIAHLTSIAESTTSRGDFVGRGP